MTVNSCQLNTGELNSAAIYNLTGHRAPGSSSIIDSNGRFVGSVSEMSKSGVNTASCNLAVSNNATQLSTGSCSGSSNSASGSGSNQIIALTNSHGITVGTSGTPYTIHDKGLLGVNVGVGVNVSCIDSRKFDYKNNNLLSNSSFQQTQEVKQIKNQCNQRTFLTAFFEFIVRNFKRQSFFFSTRFRHICFDLHSEIFTNSTPR